MKRAVLLMVASFVVGMGLETLCATEPAKTPYKVIAEVESSVVGDVAGVSTIKAFGLSPSGSELVLSFEVGVAKTGMPESNEAWIAIWDIAAKKITSRRKLAEGGGTLPVQGSDRSHSIFNDNYLFMLTKRGEVFFSEDQRYVIVMDLGRVWLLSASDLAIVRLLDLPSLGKNAPVDVKMASKSILAVTYEYDYQKFEVNLFDVPAGKRIAKWKSLAVPQSFSPNGKLAVAPDPGIRNNGGVTNVQILDAYSGEQMKTIAVGFGFTKGWFGGDRGSGSVVCKFVSDTKILVVPDGNRDSSGHHSGNTLEIIDIAQGQALREIAPKGYGPTGVLVESADRSRFAVESIYADSIWFSFESTDPKHFKHKLILFTNDPLEQVDAIEYPASKNQDYRLPVVNSNPSISLDGSTVAIGANTEVQVFRSENK